MKIEFKNNALYLDEHPYHEGDIIIGSIKGIPLTGKLRIFASRNEFFFCHNYIRKSIDSEYSIYKGDFNGSQPTDNNMLGFTKSWLFKINDDNQSFSYQVILINYKEDKNFNINDIKFPEPPPKPFIYMDFDFIKIGEAETLCQRKGIEKCCGSVLFYDFKRNGAFIYNIITDDKLDEINDYIAKIFPTNKIAYLLTDEESEAIILLKKLKFKVVEVFINSNTSRSITLLSRVD